MDWRHRGLTGLSATGVNRSKTGTGARPAGQARRSATGLRERIGLMNASHRSGAFWGTFTKARWRI